MRFESWVDVSMEREGEAAGGRVMQLLSCVLCACVVWAAGNL
jgi:hypothetical protein